MFSVHLPTLLTIIEKITYLRASEVCRLSGFVKEYIIVTIMGRGLLVQIIIVLKN